MTARLGPASCAPFAQVHTEDSEPFGVYMPDDWKNIYEIAGVSAMTVGGSPRQDAAQRVAAEAYSRRISLQDRLVYQICPNECTVKVIRL